MTDQRLSDLLHERVADLETSDLAGGAWARARRARHRRAAILGSAAVVVVLAASALAVLPGSGSDPAPPPDRSPAATAPPPSGSAAAPTAPVPRAVDVGRQHGAQIWWAPDKADEAALPRLAVAGVPEEIDLSAGSPPHRPGVTAVAMFMVGDGDTLDGRAVIVGADGATYSLDVGRLEPVSDEAGNEYLPFDERSLSPDGHHALFRQESSLEVYDLRTGEWTTIDTPDWVAEGARWNWSGEDWPDLSHEIWVPAVLGDDDGPGAAYNADGSPRGTVWPASYALWEAGRGQAYGPQTLDPAGLRLSGLGPATAQAQFPGVELAGPNGSSVSGADIVVTRDQSFSDLSVIVLPYGRDGRWKMCCPVVGWLEGPEIVLFESRGAESRVLAWRVGTPGLWRVTQLTGWVPGEDFHIGSFATLRRG